jgi:hypothetical protein
MSKPNNRKRIGMEFDTMIAPCGLECFKCTHFLAMREPAARRQVERWSRTLDIPVDKMLCKGCRAHDGRVPLHQHLFGQGHVCTTYQCATQGEAAFCGGCDSYPCGERHPYAVQADRLPQHIRSFLCL